jgi:hypothetical protein
MIRKHHLALYHLIPGIYKEKCDTGHKIMGTGGGRQLNETEKLKYRWKLVVFRKYVYGVRYMQILNKLKVP